MAQRRVVVGSRVGLHARPAALFVQAASKLPVKVTVAKVGGDPVDARSILSVLGLDVRGGQEIVLTAEGDGAEQALEELAAVAAKDHDAPDDRGANPEPPGPPDGRGANPEPPGPPDG